jgi:hypothetical protein
MVITVLFDDNIFLIVDQINSDGKQLNFDGQQLQSWSAINLSWSTIKQ